MFKILAVSHLDHALTEEHKSFLESHFRDRQSFFLETIQLPADLPALPCGLHGPIMGDAPVPDSECHLEVRGDRKGPSRVCSRPVRLVRTLTVIAGPYQQEPCVLYTAYGGPVAPREPWDPTLPEDKKQEAEKFWAEHALTE